MRDEMPLEADCDDLIERFERLWAKRSSLNLPTTQIQRLGDLLYRLKARCDDYREASDSRWLTGAPAAKAAFEDARETLWKTIQVARPFLDELERGLRLTPSAPTKGPTDNSGDNATDQYALYESGAKRLVQALKGKNGHLDALTLESRLVENIANTRRYGDNESRRADRAEIVAQLNDLALSTIGLSFNELCVANKASPNQT